MRASFRQDTIYDKQPSSDDLVSTAHRTVKTFKALRFVLCSCLAFVRLAQTYLTS